MNLQVQKKHHLWVLEIRKTISNTYDETENFVNLKGISMMELPLLKVEEEIFRRNDQ